MPEAKIIDLMSYAIPKKYQNCVSVDLDEFGEAVIRLDLHGFTKKEAMLVIKNILLLLRIEFTLDIIHGYTHGMVLSSYIHNELQNDRIVCKYMKPNNPGETFLTIAA